MSGKISPLIIPTRNRPGFLETTLAFYSEFPLRRDIVILDSSDPSQKLCVHKVVKKFTTVLNVEINSYYHSVEFFEKIFDFLSKRKDIIHFALGADDDVWIPPALEACFWEVEKGDVKTAGGILVKMEEVDFINSRYPQMKGKPPTSLLSDSRLERAKGFARTRQQRMYCVHTRDIFIDVLASVNRIGCTVNPVHQEFIFYLLLCIGGKFERINRVSYLQLLHSASESSAQKATERAVLSLSEDRLFYPYLLLLNDFLKKSNKDFYPSVKDMNLCEEKNIFNELFSGKASYVGYGGYSQKALDYLEKILCRVSGKFFIKNLPREKRSFPSIFDEDLQKGIRIFKEKKRDLAQQ